MTQVIGSFLATLGEKNMYFTYVLKFLNEFYNVINEKSNSFKAREVH